MKRVLFTAVFVITAALTYAQETPKGLMVGDAAPTFTAKSQDGEAINLETTLKKGSVVLVFYRGYWCPFCNKQLKKLEDSLSLITGKGATLIAISPEQAENIDKTVEKTKATYPIISDEGLNIMKSYDVAYAVSQQTIEQYKKYDIDFTKVNGKVNGANLPVPAVYVINKEGKIVYRHFDPDYTKRASVKDILDHL